MKEQRLAVGRYCEGTLWCYPLGRKDRASIGPDGSVDEVVAEGLAHLERLEGNTWLLSLEHISGAGTMRLRVRGSVELMEPAP
jgi:hypothetical protein